MPADRNLTFSTAGSDPEVPLDADERISYVGGILTKDS
jgi:hypothetical protein